LILSPVLFSTNGQLPLIRAPKTPPASTHLPHQYNLGQHNNTAQTIGAVVFQGEQPFAQHQQAPPRISSEGESSAIVFASDNKLKSPDEPGVAPSGMASFHAIACFASRLNDPS